LDGRGTRGSIDDYWVKVDSTAPDPYITGGWPQHAWGDAIGDYMKTSQSFYENQDGASVFYTWTSLPTKLTCADMENYGWAYRDGSYGRKLFYEARGYTVTDCYNQKTDNNEGGFTLANFMAEIDAGRPVLLNLEGHSIVGYGYNGNTIYIRDTWDNDPSKVYTMPWGGSYEGMKLLSVSVVSLGQGSAVPSKQYLPVVIKVPAVPVTNFLNPGFEQGRVAWNESSTQGWDLIVPDSAITDGSVKAHGGSWLTWLGGGNNETSIISQTVTISAGAPYLHFWYWIGSQDVCGYDYFYVGVNGNYFYNETICHDRNTGGWVKKVINLSAFVGTGKTVQFRLITDSSLNSNVFIDDVSMSASSYTSEQSPMSPDLFPGAALERR